MCQIYFGNGGKEKTQIGGHGCAFCDLTTRDSDRIV
jgi:hypothetical protein